MAGSGKRNPILINAGTFTLVELLVVISIISVLAALLFPALQKAQVYGRQINCANKLKNIGLALSMYGDDYNFLPAVERAGLPWWWASVHPYLADHKPATSNYPTLEVLRCQVQADKMARIFQNSFFVNRPSYGMNGFLGPSWGTVFYRLEQFRFASTTFAVSECGFGSGSMQVSTNYNRLLSSAYDNGTMGSGGTYLGGVHAGANNLLWLDLHVSAWRDVITTGLPPYALGSAEDIWRRGL